MQLITPHEQFQHSYLAYIAELGDEERYPYPLDLDHSNFPLLIKLLTDYANGRNLPDWLVPNSTYWLMDGAEIVGCSHLRHRLNAQLKEAGGHIGLGVRPSRRGQGVGKILLNLTLQQAKLKGLKAVHIHCHANNQASVNLIASVGGQLDSKIVPRGETTEVLRFVVNSY